MGHSHWNIPPSPPTVLFPFTADTLITQFNYAGFRSLPVVIYLPTTDVCAMINFPPPGDPMEIDLPSGGDPKTPVSEPIEAEIPTYPVHMELDPPQPFWERFLAKMKGKRSLAQVNNAPKRVFQCSQCRMHFSDKIQLYHHGADHARQTGFHCGLCPPTGGRIFASTDGLMSHQATVHNVQATQYPGQPSQYQGHTNKFYGKAKKHHVPTQLHCGQPPSQAYVPYGQAMKHYGQRMKHYGQRMKHHRKQYVPYGQPKVQHGPAPMYHSPAGMQHGQPRINYGPVNAHHGQANDYLRQATVNPRRARKVAWRSRR